MKWAKKVGIPEGIANITNRVIDYGFNWVFSAKSENIKNNDDPRFLHLTYFYEMDPKNKNYIKAYYLHRALDHLKETRHKELDKALKKFETEKCLIEIERPNGQIITFKKELEGILTLLRQNEKNVLSDIN